ncbi:MAG: hypothetical protein Q9170_002451 [Blastenia crenularia]
MFTWPCGHQEVSGRTCLWDDAPEELPPHHGYTTHDLGAPRRPCPQCGLQAPAPVQTPINPYAYSQPEDNLKQPAPFSSTGLDHRTSTTDTSVEEISRRHEEVRALVAQHSREVIDRLVTRPTRSRSTPTTETENQGAALATVNPEAGASTFQFNPRTAVHGEFHPGAEGWRPDQRSRRARAAERDTLRIERAERAGISKQF